ncbi:MAG: OmpA family protein [Pikeienuella sp.]
MRRLALAFFSTMVLSACAGEVGLSPENSSFGDAVSQNNLAQPVAFRVDEYLFKVNDEFARATPEAVEFGFNRSVLSAQAKAALDAQARWLNEFRDIRVRLVGHTDLVGGEPYNESLGLKRAQAATRYLVAKGVQRSRIDAVESRGEREPLIPITDKEQRNRRTVTVIAGFTHGFYGDGLNGRRSLLTYQRYVTDSVDSPRRSSSTSGGG